MNSPTNQSEIPWLLTRAAGNDHFCDTTKRASQRLFCSYKGGFPCITEVGRNFERSHNPSDPQPPLPAETSADRHQHLGRHPLRAAQAPQRLPAARHLGHGPAGAQLVLHQVAHHRVEGLETENKTGGVQPPGEPMNIPIQPLKWDLRIKSKPFFQ